MGIEEAGSAHPSPTVIVPCLSPRDSWSSRLCLQQPPELFEGVLVLSHFPSFTIYKTNFILICERECGCYLPIRKLGFKSQTLFK